MGAEIHDQTVRLPAFQLMIVFLALNLSLFLSFLDSSSVSTAQPSIARDLNAGSSITWVGTSYLVANTGFQIITSRLSDIFGRKAILLGALGIFGLGDLLCGFAKTPTWLYGCRALAGIGGGGINSLSMIVLSDVVSMKTRGKYMSLLGISIALGSGVGPEVGGLLAEKATWRWVFWITPPMTAVTMVLIVFLLPLKKVPGSVTDKLKAVDWLGSVLSLGGIVMLLVPISGGGTTYAWSSPTVISLLVIGTLMLVAFICVQVWVAKLPILPLGMFKNRTVALLIVQTWFVGMVMYGNLYMAPLYLQNVLGYSPIMAGVMMIPYLVGQIVTTTIAGFVVNATGTNKPGFTIGFLLWAAGQGAQICFGKSTSVGVVVGILLLQGLGIGATLQTTLVLAQASCKPSERAVVTGARNFARTSGGAIGLALCNAIINAVFPKHLPSDLPSSIHDALEVDGFSSDYQSQVTTDQWSGIEDAYSLALRDVFIFFVPLVIMCFILCFGMKESPLVDNAAGNAEVGREKETKLDLEAGPEAPEIPSSDSEPDSEASSRTAVNVLPVADLNGGSAGAVTGAGASVVDKAEDDKRVASCETRSVDSTKA